jgi:transcriptional regulator with XRE-family HTH domain
MTARSGTTASKVIPSREGRKIRLRRLKLRLTQEGLARQVGVTTHTIWRLETDADFNPRLETLRALATALGVQVSFIIT